MKINVKKEFLVFLGIAFAIFSCKFNPNVQEKGADYLQGIWKQEKVMYQDQLLNYALHTLTFTCDSFYLVLDTHAKMNIYPDSCFNNGHWTEYVKGEYLVDRDTLHLSGTFTKPNYKQKISGCYRTGQYFGTFIIQKQKHNVLSLQDISQHLPIELFLQQSIVCSPKPIK